MALCELRSPMAEMAFDLAASLVCPVCEFELPAGARCTSALRATATASTAGAAFTLAAVPSAATQSRFGTAVEPKRQGSPPCRPSAGPLRPYHNAPWDGGAPARLPAAAHHLHRRSPEQRETAERESQRLYASLRLYACQRLYTSLKLSLCSTLLSHSAAVSLSFVWL